MPPFDPVHGRLPPGCHVVSLEEFIQLFAWNDRRRGLLEGILRVARALREAGVSRLWLGGSYISDRESPGDFDGCYPLEEVNMSALDPVLLGADPLEMKTLFGGEVYAHCDASKYLLFFSYDREDRSVGTVELDLTTLP